MNYQVVTETVCAQTLAAVQRRVFSRDIGRTWKPALDLVWEFLHRQNGLWAGGHNCFVYHHPARPGLAMDIDFGVQVTRSFADENEIKCTQTPAGEVAMTTHVGSYDKLADAHDAIREWLSTTGRASGGCSWEIYGDWTADESKLETHVVYLLG